MSVHERLTQDLSGARTTLSDPLFVPASAPSYATQPGLGETVAARDINLLLQKLIDHAMLDCNGACGALQFAGPQPIRIRRGHWSDQALEQLLTWERIVANELQRHPMHIVTVPPPSEARLNDDLLNLLVNAPLLAGARVVGTLTLAFASNNPPPENYGSLINQAAANIGALAHLMSETNQAHQKLTQLELFFQIGQNMVSTLDLTRLLIDTTGIATSILNAGAASLMLIDEERQELVFEVALGEKGPSLVQSRMPMDQGIAGWVATNGIPQIVNDVASDQRFAKNLDSLTGFLTQSIICVPLRIKGKTIGVLEVLNTYSGEGFDEEDEELLMTIAGQAAIAIENARLYQSLREERDRIITAQEDVRHELARNLHDGIVGLLAAITMNVDHIERLLKLKPEAVPGELEAVRALTRQASRQARLLLFELRPVILETRGLVAALGSYVEQVASSEEFMIHLDAEQYLGRLSSKIEGIIFSIIQEALNNIKRHAHADNIWLRLKLDLTTLSVEIEDDGVGFERPMIEQAYDERGSLGLLNMRERAELLEGELIIQSLSEGREKGTVITLLMQVDDDMWEGPPPHKDNESVEK